MAVYTHLSNNEIHQLLTTYYSLPVRFERAEPIASGTENSNYFIYSRTNNGALARHILTLYEKRINPKNLPFFMQLTLHLSTKNIVSPAPIPSKNGTLFNKTSLARAGEKYFSLTQFLPGASCDSPTPSHCAQMGEWIAKLHLATQDFSLTRENDLSLSFWLETAQTLIPHLSATRQNETTLAELLRHECAYLKEHWPTQGSLPQGVVHADLFPDNIFFNTENQLSGVIDFYFACNDFFAYDFAITLNSWCFKNGAFLKENARAMLSHYQAKRPFTPAEMAALPLMLRGAAMRFLLTRLHDRVFPPSSQEGSTRSPKEYVEILQFHREMRDISAYGITS